MSKLEMKKCKECGKMFMPTSNKQKYCSEDHYRPCPVCGKPVFAKYLSDPARCCSGVCKSKLGKLNKTSAYVAEVMQQKADLGIKVPKINSFEVLDLTPEVVAYAEADAKATEEAYDGFNKSEVIDPTDGTVRKKYTGETYDGWIAGNDYAVIIEQVGKEHVVKATYNYTTREAVDLEYGFTNKKKISTIFKASK